MDATLLAAVGVEEEEMEEAAPSELNPALCGNFLYVSKDKLSVRYKGQGNHDHNVGAIQANCPAPAARLLYYFEVLVKDRGDKGLITIGFSDSNFKPNKQPGSEASSYGYRGDTGRAYHSSTSGEAYGPPFAANDVIGAGIRYSSREIFFTKNGQSLGTAFSDVKRQLYPTISLHSNNERVELNFGQRPFLFDVEALLQEERSKRQAAIESIQLPLAISQSVVRSYLSHYGYAATLKAFDAASGGEQAAAAAAVEGMKGRGAGDGSGGESEKVKSSSSLGQHEESFALEERRRLRQLIRSGDIDAAHSHVLRCCPHILKDDAWGVVFLLQTQKFIELLRSGASDAAMDFARSHLAKYRGKAAAQDAMLADCVTLLAYEHPEESPLAHLLSLNQREAVADVINATILAHYSTSGEKEAPRPPCSTLELLLKQLTLCHMEKREANGDQGEVFNLRRILQGVKDGRW